MKIKAQGFIPDIILEILEYGTRRNLAKLQLLSYAFYVLIERYFPRKPYLSILTLDYQIYPNVRQLLNRFSLINKIYYSLLMNP